MNRKITFALIVVTFLTGCASSGKSSKEANLDHKVDSVLRLMTLDEKIGQMVLYSSDWDVTGPSIKKIIWAISAKGIVEIYSMPIRQLTPVSFRKLP